VSKCDAGVDPHERECRPRLIDPFLAKVVELVERSEGKIRADLVHGGLLARALTVLSAQPPGPSRKSKRPGVMGTGGDIGRGFAEPGMWLQLDWGESPKKSATADPVVLLLAGVVTVSGGNPDVGSDDARFVGGLLGCGGADDRRSSDLCTDQ
jgi:hypothetical protein